jgi:hypothetical protein
MDLAKQQPKKFIDTIKIPSNVISMSPNTWGLTTQINMSKKKKYIRSCLL